MYKLKKENISGISPIIIENAEKDNLLLNIEGNSKQETTKGLQILENTNEGVTGWNFIHGNGNANISEVVEDGIKCSKFTVTEAMSNYRVLLRDCNLKKLKNNSTYTIAYDLKMNKTGKFNTSICNTAGRNTLAGFPQVKYITADQWQHIKIVANTYDTTIDSQLLYMTVQPNENGFTEVGDYIEIRNLILAEGDYSEQDLDWERYTGVEAMPNLNYPSEVEAVGDNINLFDKDTAIDGYYVNSDGNLIKYTTQDYYASDYIEVLQSNQYTYSNSSIQTGYAAKGAFYDKDKTFLSYFNINNSTTTITTPENCKYIRMSVREIDIDKFKIEKGTAATPCSPYGQGNIEIIHNNKNELILNDNNSQSDGLNFSIKDGVITISGTATSTYQGLYIPVKRTFNEDYVLSTNAVGSKTGLHIKATYKLENGNLQYPDIFTRFVFPTNSYLEQLYVIVDSGSTIDATIKLQLEKGTEVSDFTVGKLNKYILPIQKPFYKVGDYKDSFVKQNKKWYEQHFIEKFDLSDENIDWHEDGAGQKVNTYRWDNRIKIENIDSANSRNNFSNYFSKNYVGYNNDEVGFGLENSSFRVRLPVSISTPEQVKSFWQEKAKTQIPYIYYVLATPKLIECTEEQSDILDNFETFDGQNIITVDTFNNTNPNILIDYTPKMIDEIKEAFTKNITKAYVIRTRDGFEINQDNYLKDYKLEELRFVPDNGFIGGTVARRLTLDFNNVDNQFDIQDEDLRFFAGVEYEGKDYYIDYGNFIVQKPETENTTDNTNATCLDYMCLLNATYNDEMTYPCTLGELAENVCSQAGLELATKTFRNSDFIVTDNQFVNNEPLRTVLGAIALSAFSWARIGQDNRVYIDFTIKQQEDISLDYDSYFNLSMASKPFGPINRIVLRNSQVEGENITVQDDESIAENGVHELVIADNPFAYTQEKREQLIEAGKEFYGFTYMPITSMDTIGYAFLDSNSLIKINDMQDKANYAYVFNHTIDYNGALLDSIESPALTETETKYTYTPEEVQKQRRTEIIVNKHEQTITSIIQEQDELTNRQNVLEQNLDSTTNTISEVNEDLTERINQLQVNLDGLSQTVSQKGGDNIFSYDKEFWTGATDDDVSNLEEYTDTDIQQNSVSGVGYIINKGTSRQNVQVKNDTYTISFTYKKLVELATGYVLINGTRYDLTSTNWDEIVVTLDVNTNYVDFGIISDTNNAFEIFDLMGSIGNEKQVWTQNANETRTDTVKIGKGITVSSSLTNTIWKADADGNRIINTDTGETVAEFTDKGTVTKNIEVQETAEIAGILIQEIDNQTWISSLL